MQNVVVSSIPLRPWLKQALRITDESEDGDLLCISSSRNAPGHKTPSTVHAGRVPFIRGYYVGVGDLFSSFIVAHYKPSTPTLTANAKLLDTASGETPLSRAVTAALTKTHAILSATNEYWKQQPEEERQPTDDEADAKDADRVVRRMRGRELRLIQSQDVIRGTTLPIERKMSLWSDFW